MSKPPPPAKRGNRLGVSHGAYARVPAERLREKEQVIDQLASEAPVRALDGSLPAHDRVAVRLLAETLCRLDDVQAWIDEHGIFDTRRKKPAQNQRNRRGRPKTRHSKDPMRAIEMEDRLMARAMRMLDALGMTPTARARLGVDLVRSRDLAREWSQPEVIEGSVEDA